MAELFANPWYQPLSGSVETYAGAKLYFYQTGTTTAQNVYTDAALSVAHTNPVVADADGRFAPIYLDNGAAAKYKVVLKDSADTTLQTVDPFPMAADELQEDLASTATTAKGAALLGYKHGGSTGTFTSNASASSVQKKLDNICIEAISDFDLTTGDMTTQLQNAMNAANTGGYRLHIGPGTYEFSNLTIPSGRGLIIQGSGQNKTILKHTGSAKGIEIGADGIQRFVLQNLSVQPSANTTSLLAYDGDFSAYGFELYNVELNEGSSNNNTVTMLKIGGGTTLSHQKHYFTGCGIKIFGGGIGVHIDGVNVSSAGLSNDHRFWGIQIQSCALDGLLLEDTFNNDFVASIESCGDGVTYFCYRLEGIADDNRVYGRLEYTGTSNEVYLNNSSGENNAFRGSLSATPANANDLAEGGEVAFNGLILEDQEYRNKGLYRPIPATTSTYFLRSALPTDTMGSLGRFGIRADGHMGWAASTNPSQFDANLDWDSGNGHLRFLDGGGGTFKAIRTPALVLDDGITPQGTLSGMAQLYVDTADGDLKIKFGDGTVKTIVTDT